MLKISQLQLFSVNLLTSCQENLTQTQVMIHTQTCHLIEMKNLDLTNKKSGSRGKYRDHGRIGYNNRNNSPKRGLFVVYFFQVMF